MKKYLLLFFGCVLSLALVSCSDNEPDQQGPEDPPPTETETDNDFGISSEDPRVTVNEIGTSAIIDYDAVGGNVIIKVSTDLSWDVAAETDDQPGWLSATKSGTAITITASEMEDLGERSGKVKITADSRVRSTIIVNQIGLEMNGEPRIMLQEYSTDLTDAGGTRTIRVMSNQPEWGFVDPQTDWLSVSKSSDDKYLVLEAGVNATGDEYKTNVKIFGSENGNETISADLEVTQWAKCMIIQFTTTATNQTIYLPFWGDVDVKMIFADKPEMVFYETKNINTDATRILRTMPDAGTYEISISGSVEKLDYTTSNTLSATVRSRLSGIKQWGNLNVVDSEWAFYGSKITSLPADTEGFFSKIKSLKFAFHTCTSLTEVSPGLLAYVDECENFDGMFNGAAFTQIPAGFLDKCGLATSFINTFQNCKQLTSVPANLFAHCPDVTDFTGCFKTCEALTTVPGDLFANQPKVTSFYEIFHGSGLTSVPEGLFAGCPEVTDFRSAFQNTKSLTTVPKDLFKNSSKATHFNSLFNGSALIAIPEGFFDGCTSAMEFSSAFSTSAITAVPDRLFANCPEATMFNETFNACVNLETIGVDVFKNCRKATSFQSTFRGKDNSPYAVNKIKIIPAGLFDDCISATTFQNCFKRTSVVQVPAGLFKNCNEVLNFSNLFSQCPDLQTVPGDIFEGCVNATDFTNMFQASTSLNSIPANLFSTNVAAKTFSYVFSGCTGLTTVPSGLFANNPAVTLYANAFQNCTGLLTIGSNVFVSSNVESFSNVFQGCSSLTAIPADIFDGTPNITGFSASFRECTSLTAIPADLFDNHTKTTSFTNTFYGCTGLTALPALLFDKNRAVTAFTGVFQNCTNLEGESPYTTLMIEDEVGVPQPTKVHLYERTTLGAGVFTSASGSNCFRSCNKLDDYDKIPSNWK